MLDIILPFYGPPQYLHEAVDSVLAQTSSEWHLTILDDRYPDESVAQHFADHPDERITYVRNEVNLGITDNYRKGLTFGSAEHLMFMGGDDRMAPGFVATVLDAARRYPQVEMIQPGVEIIDLDGDRHTPLADRIKARLRPAGETLLAGEGAASTLLAGNWLYWPSLVFKRSAIEAAGFLDGFPLAQDLGVELEILRAGGRLLVVPHVVFSYRRHAASASSATLMDGGRFADERAFFELQAEKMAAVGWHRAARAARLHLTSRLYAASLLPQAVKARDLSSARTLTHHMLTPRA